MEKLVQGYVIRITPYLENDCILTVLEKDSGNFVVFKARGVLKSTSKNAPSCQLYTLGEYLLDYKTEKSATQTLKSGSVVERMPRLYEKMEVNVVLGLVAEGILKIGDEITAKKRWELFSKVYEALKSLSNYKTIILVVLKYFMLYCGVLLEADCCVECGGKKRIVDVSYAAGGYICYDCNKRVDPRRGAEYLKNYRYVMKASLDNVYDFVVPDATASILIREFCEYLENSTGLKLKSGGVIAGIL